MRLLLRCAALCCAFIALAAQARPFTVDDLLKVDRRSELGVSPDGRWLVLTVTRGQAYAPRFDYDAVYPYAARRLYRVDLTHPGPATPLIPAEASAGYTAGPFSPDGRRLLVNRLRGHEWETGVVDIATGAVRWLGVGMDFPLFGRAAQWLSNREVIAIVTPASQPHFIFRRGWQRTDFLSRARRATATDGGPSVLAIGSGRFLDRGAEGPRKTLARIDIETGSVTPLAVGEFQDLEVAPSGRYVAAIKNGADVQPQPGETIRGGTAMRLRDLVVIDLMTDTAVAGCDDCALSPFLMAWSPTADRLLVYARRPGEAVARGRLRIVAPRNGRLNVAVLDQVRPMLGGTYEGFEIVQAGWVGGTPAVLGRRSEDPETQAPIWLRLGAEGPRPLLPRETPPLEKIVADARGDLLAIGGGKAFRLHHGRLSQIDDVSIAPNPLLGETGRPVITKLTPGDELLVRRKGRLVRLGLDGDHDLGPVDQQALLSSREGWSMTARRDAHGVEVIEIDKDGAATNVLTLNPQLAAVEFGSVRPVAHRGPNGETLTSWVVLPANWRADAPPPLVVLPYPGLGVYGPAAPPEAARAGAGLTNISPHVLAGHGYAVLYPSLPRDRYPDDPAQDLAAQILTVVDAVGAAGLADPNRVALWGHSFGGHAALAAATQSDRFKAIVCTAGVADIVSAWGHYGIQSTPEEGFAFTGVAGYVETGQMRVGGPPWTDPDRYVRNSPLFHADKITAPVLLAYGDLDEYGDGQGGEMFSALYRQGKDAKLLTFWGEGHVVSAPGNVQRLYDEVLDWLDLAFGRDGSPKPGNALSP